MAEKRATQTGTGTPLPAQLLLLTNLQRQIELLQSNTSSRAAHYDDLSAAITTAGTPFIMPVCTMGVKIRERGREEERGSESVIEFVKLAMCAGGCALNRIK